MAYSEKVIDHAENPRNVGTLDKDDPNVGTGLVGAPACGDVMRLQIRVNEDGVIEDAKFKTFGCGSAIASSSLATEWLKGKTVEEAETIKNVDIVNELNLPPVKIHCSVLAEDAIKSAIEDYRQKQAERRAGAQAARRSANAEQETAYEVSGVTMMSIERRPAARARRRPPPRRAGKTLDDRGVPQGRRGDQEADRQARRAGHGAARRDPRRRLLGLQLRHRVPRRRAAPEGPRARLCRARRDAGARRGGPEEPPLPERHHARVGADAHAAGVQVHQSAGKVELRLRSLVHRCEPAAAVATMDPFATLGIERTLRRGPRGSREAVPRAVADAPPGPLRPRGP